MINHIRTLCQSEDPSARAVGISRLRALSGLLDLGFFAAAVNVSTERYGCSLSRASVMFIGKIFDIEGFDDIDLLGCTIGSGGTLIEPISGDGSLVISRLAVYIEDKLVQLFVSGESLDELKSALLMADVGYCGDCLGIVIESFRVLRNGMSMSLEPEFNSHCGVMV